MINKEIIEEIYSNNQEYKGAELNKVKDIIASYISYLEKGEVSVCDKDNGEWIVNQTVKKAILLYFRFFESKVIEHDGYFVWYDKIGNKFNNWSEDDFIKSKIRAVPGAIVRKGVHIAENVVLMPSFVNIGARILSGTMIDSWVTIGSCAQIGKNCHISSGVDIGGVLEPINNAPVIIEDNCFIGSGSKITESIIVEEGAVISAGVILTSGTKIVDRETGRISYGVIPKNSVIIPGALPGPKDLSPSISCAVIVKRVDDSTRKKTSINELLRY